MKKVMRATCFLNLYLLLLVAWTGPASAGAPVPPPEKSGPHPEHQLANLGEFQFENGQVVKDFKVSYVTHGKLNENQDNIILAMHGFSGDHHNADFLIGPGKALDTGKYFIVATDMLGSSLVRQDTTTGPTSSGLKMKFPHYTMRDSVNLEYKFFTEYLGFDQILAAVGISVGGMKAFQLAVSHPTFVRGVVPIAGTPVTNPKTRAQLRSVMKIITVDSGWYGGNYKTNPTTGLTTTFLNFALWLYGDSWYATNLRTAEQYRQWEKTMHDLWTIQFPEDARDIYYQAQLWADFDLGDTPGFNGDAESALRSIKAQVLIISAKEDLLFSREESIFAKNAIPNATHLELDSPFGHAVAVGLDPEATKIMEPEITKFLSNLQ